MKATHPHLSPEQLDYARIAREDQREAAQRARDRRRSWQLGVFGLGRVLLGAVFLGNAAGMLADYSGTLASLQETVFDVRRWLPVAIAFELGAGAAIALGLYARVAALLTAAYLVAVLLVVPPDLGTDLGRAVGLATAGVFSALAMVAAHGPGRLSLDHALAKRRRAPRRASPASP